MPIFRLDPFRELMVLQEGLDRLPEASTPGWLPPVDLYETPAEYVLLAEVAGLSRDDVEVIVHDGKLWLQGRRAGTTVKPERCHRVERGHGSFSRVFAFREPVDAAAVTADLQDGILRVTIPKTKAPGARRIDVQ